MSTATSQQPSTSAGSTATSQQQPATIHIREVYHPRGLPPHEIQLEILHDIPLEIPLEFPHEIPHEIPHDTPHGITHEIPLEFRLVHRSSTTSLPRFYHSSTTLSSRSAVLQLLYHWRGQVSAGSTITREVAVGSTATSAATIPAIPASTSY